MDNKEFARKRETRTKEFAINIIKLSASLPYDSEYKVIKNQLTKSGKTSELIIVRLTGQEVRLILPIKLEFVKARLVRPFIG